MKTFEIFFHPKFGFKAVKQGFSWPAFLFTPVWALYKRMWLYAIFFVSVSLVLAYVQSQFEESMMPAAASFSLALRVLVLLVFGVFGNQLFKNELLVKGYRHLRTLNAETPDAAISQSVDIKKSGNTNRRVCSALLDTLELAKEAYLKRDYKTAYSLFLEAETDQELDAMSKRIKHQALMRIKLGVV